MNRGNPYDWTREIVDTRLFAGRRDELQSIEKDIVGLTAGESIPHIAIVGERRVGKSSLLRRVAEIGERHKLIAVRTELSSVSACDPWEFWRELLHEIQASLTSMGIVCSCDSRRPLGFDLKDPQDSDTAASKGRLQFEDAYQAYQSHTGSSVLATYIISGDLRTVCQAVSSFGYEGIILMIDEAHYFQLFREHAIGPLQIKQQLKQALRDLHRCMLVLAGEVKLSQVFNDDAEPLFGQGRVIPLGNFLSRQEVVECALQPLNDDEHALMSPMTVDYLARLSQGKPNQIRLICRTIYDRYADGKQNDLNITIDILDDLLEQVGTALSTEHDLSKQAERIRGLNSVDLEVLHNMTRYPHWAVDTVVDLDESFRGECKSTPATSRRRRLLDQKKEQFIAMNLMVNEPDRFSLAGTEFLYLYLRFWREVRKYGRLSRRLVIGEIPHTPFNEKTQKLVDALAWELRQGPGISRFIFHPNSREVGEVIINRVRERFSTFDNVLRGEEADIKGKLRLVSECFQICELVSKPGTYYLLCLTVRNLDIPRELMQVELYFESTEIRYINLTELMKIINRQAVDARIMVEEFDLLPVNLLDVPSVLDAIGGPTFESVIQKLGLVERWHITAIQHVHKSREATHERADEKAVDDVGKEWIRLYDKGDPKAAEEYLNEKLREATERPEIARFHNDRGYIRYSLNENELARRDLERALDLHFANLSLTLLDLSFLDIVDGDYQEATRRIEEALLLTLGREELDAGYLRTLVPECHMPLKRIWEHRPANLLDASYINLAFSVFKLYGVDKGLEVIDEGLSLMPSSIRLKHALARFHLSRKQAALATPIYEELSQLSIADKGLLQEVRLFLQRAPRRSRKSRKQT